MLMDKGPHFFLFVTLWKTGELKKGMLINNFGTNEHLNKGSFQKGSFRLRSLHIAPASLIAIPFSGIPESNFYDAIYNFSAI